MGIMAIGRIIVLFTLIVQALSAPSGCIESCNFFQSNIHKTSSGYRDHTANLVQARTNLNDYDYAKPGNWTEHNQYNTDNGHGKIHEERGQFVEGSKRVRYYKKNFTTSYGDVNAANAAELDSQHRYDSIHVPSNQHIESQSAYGSGQTAVTKEVGYNRAHSQQTQSFRESTRINSESERLEDFGEVNQHSLVNQHIPGINVQTIDTHHHVETAPGNWNKVNSYRTDGGHGQVFEEEGQYITGPKKVNYYKKNYTSSYSSGVPQSSIGSATLDELHTDLQRNLQQNLDSFRRNFHQVSSSEHTAATTHVGSTAGLTQETVGLHDLQTAESDNYRQHLGYRGTPSTGSVHHSTEQQRETVTDTRQLPHTYPTAAANTYGTESHRTYQSHETHMSQVQPEPQSSHLSPGYVQIPRSDHQIGYHSTHSTGHQLDETHGAAVLGAHQSSVLQNQQLTENSQRTYNPHSSHSVYPSRQGETRNYEEHWRSSSQTGGSVSPERIIAGHSGVGYTERAHYDRDAYNEHRRRYHNAQGYESRAHTSGSSYDSAHRTNSGQLVAGSLDLGHAHGADCTEETHQQYQHETRYHRKYKRDDHHGNVQQHQAIDDFTQQNQEFGQETQQLEDLTQQQTQGSDDFTQQTNSKLELGQQIVDNQHLDNLTQQSEQFTQQTEGQLEFGQQTVGNSHLEDLTQQNEQFTQQTQGTDDLTQQTSDKLEFGQQTIDNHRLDDLTQQSEQFTQQTEGQLEFGQQTVNNPHSEDLTQQTQGSDDFTQQTSGKLEFGQQTIDNHRLDDLTQQSEQFTQQTEGQLEFGQQTVNNPHSEDLTQQTQGSDDLTQQTSGKLEFGQQTIDNHRLDDLTQQSEQFTQQTEGQLEFGQQTVNNPHSKDLMQQTQESDDLMQQTSGKLEFGQQTINNHRLDDLTQQSEQFTQQTEGQLEFGQQTINNPHSEDLTQQTQDFAQQTSDNFGQQNDDAQQLEQFTQRTARSDSLTQQTQLDKHEFGQQIVGDQHLEDSPQQNKQFTQQTVGSDDFTQQSVDKLEFGRQTQSTDKFSKPKSQRLEEFNEQNEDFTQPMGRFDDFTQQTQTGHLEVGQMQQPYRSSKPKDHHLEDFTQQNEDMTRQSGGFDDFSQQTAGHLEYGQQREQQQNPSWPERLEQYSQQNEYTDNLSQQSHQYPSYDNKNDRQSEWQSLEQMSQKTNFDQDFTQQTEQDQSATNIKPAPKPKPRPRYQKHDFIPSHIDRTDTNIDDVSKPVEVNPEADIDNSHGRIIESGSRATHPESNHHISKVSNFPRGGSVFEGHKQDTDWTYYVQNSNDATIGMQWHYSYHPSDMVNIESSYDKSYPNVHWMSQQTKDVQQPADFNQQDRDMLGDKHQNSYVSQSSQHDKDDQHSRPTRFDNQDSDQTASRVIPLQRNENSPLTLEQETQSTPATEKQTENKIESRILQAYGGGPYDASRNDDFYTRIRPNPSATLPPMYGGDDPWDIREKPRESLIPRTMSTVRNIPDIVTTTEEITTQTVDITTTQPSFWRRVGHKITSTYDKAKEKAKEIFG